jgi:hypothetical protein
MGRTNLDLAIAKLRHEIKICEEYRKKLLNYIEKLKDKCINKQITYCEYEVLKDKKLDGKTISEWINHYDSHIIKCEKNIQKEIRKFKRKKVLPIIFSLFLISLVVLALFYLTPTLVGFITQEQTNTYTESLNLEFSESQNYEWELENLGQLESLEVSGLVEGDGEVKIYLDDLLILDSSEIKSKKAKITGGVISEVEEDRTIVELFLGFFQKTFLTITGRVAEDGESDGDSGSDGGDSGGDSGDSDSGSSSESTSDSSSDSSSSSESSESTSQESESSESQTQESYSEEIGEEALQKEISPSQEESLPTSEESKEEIEGVEEDIEETEEIEEIEETEITEEVEEEETEEVEEETESKDSGEEITIKEFKDLCEETCNLKKLNLNKSSYTLKIEISNAKLNLDKIKYEIIEISGEKEEEIEEPVEEPENQTAPKLIKEISDIYIQKNKFVDLKILEYFENADEYYFLQTENISTTTYDHTIRIHPDENFTGTREGKIITSNDFGNTESNIFNIIISDEISENITEIPETNITIPENITEIPEISVENITEANATITTTQSQIIAGKPVKWKKHIQLPEPKTIKIQLPKQSTNIKVNKIIEQKLELSQESYSEEIGEEDLQSEISPSQEDSLPTSETSEENQTIESEEETKEKNKKETKLKAKASITGIVIQETEKTDDSFFKSIINFFKNTFATITGRVVTTQEQEETIEIIINDNATQYEIEYETPAPELFETNISQSKKQITISAPDELNYTNILAYTQLQKEARQNSIKLYRTTDGIREPVKIINYTDLNNNSLIDYIEWIVPELSNQTYELIIEISGAEHLDKDRNFISDIYDEVFSLDDIWSETINNNEYVRVSFKQNLTSDNDITIYPRIVNGNPKIEVYEFNDDELIAEFDSLNNNEYNKVFLTNLQESQDVFDLKILGGSVEFDHIIDPNLSNGTGTWQDGGTGDTGCGAGSIDTINSVYCDGGSFDIDTANEQGYVNVTHTQAIPGGSTITSAWICAYFSVTAKLDDHIDDNVTIYVGENDTAGGGAWTYYAKDSCSGVGGCDAAGWETPSYKCYDVFSIINDIPKASAVQISVRAVSGDGDNNQEIRYDYGYVNITYTSADSTAPDLNITYPANNTNSSDNKLNINYTYGDASDCWYSNDTYAANITLPTCANITTLTWPDGYHNVTVWANDSVPNVNSSFVAFTIDTTDPNIIITNPTNNSNLSSATFDLNYTFTESTGDKCWYSNDSGGTNSSYGK